MRVPLSTRTASLVPMMLAAMVLAAMNLGCSGYPPAGPHQDELQGPWVLEAIDGDPSRAVASGCAGAEVGSLLLSTQSASSHPQYDWKACKPDLALADYGEWSEQNFVIRFDSRARVGLGRYVALARQTDGFFRLEITAKGHVLRFRREQP